MRMLAPKVGAANSSASLAIVTYKASWPGLVLGAIMLAGGLAMVLAHNLWSGGALVVIVTLVGWLTIIKSLFFLFLPREVEAEVFLRQLHYQQLFYLYGGVSLVLGVYLTYGGFTSRSH
jgi:hypothetical protein